MINPIHPTPYPDVNAVLRELLVGVQAVLGQHMVGMYLEGSLVNGDFDESSDIDFVVAADIYLGAESAKDFFAALYDLHVQIAAGLASNLNQLAHLRSALRQKMLASPIMDAPQFARDVPVRQHSIDLDLTLVTEVQHLPQPSSRRSIATPEAVVGKTRRWQERSLKSNTTVARTAICGTKGTQRCIFLR